MSTLETIGLLTLVIVILLALGHADAVQIQEEWGDDK